LDAFRHLAPVSDRYATLPVAVAFTWSACAGAIEPGEYYLVAFRSVRAPNADEARLAAYDDRAHAEAASSAGFVHYLKGPTASDGSSLSFCLWTTRPAARAAAGQPAHAQAAQLVHEMYSAYRLEFVRVRKAHRSASLEFEPFDRPTSGGHDGDAAAA
jgi:hypothetical protein